MQQQQQRVHYYPDDFYVTLVSNDKSSAGNKPSNFTVHLQRSIELVASEITGDWEVGLLEYQYSKGSGATRPKRTRDSGEEKDMPARGGKVQRAPRDIVIHRDTRVASIDGHAISASVNRDSWPDADKIELARDGPVSIKYSFCVKNVDLSDGDFVVVMGIKENTARVRLPITRGVNTGTTAAHVLELLHWGKKGEALTITFLKTGGTGKDTERIEVSQQVLVLDYLHQ